MLLIEPGKRKGEGEMTLTGVIKRHFYVLHVLFVRSDSSAATFAVPKIYGHAPSG